MSDSSRSHGLQPTRLLRPWDFPGKSTGVGCHCLLRIKAADGKGTGKEKECMWDLSSPLGIELASSALEDDVLTTGPPETSSASNSYQSGFLTAGQLALITEATTSCYCFAKRVGFLVTQLVKNPPAMQETWV
ncbi:unnamed protein product [Rangifer tarandus platyrhynchus]|uniref:Uncharacterized protein n=1 Tax=Rangifer tarandus platyrhynchus TaxID=3082113 RepID=A0ABN9A4J4_RANTA|nr:unnamed protein product [Rangifer tarandus platyrhynchus]